MRELSAADFLCQKNQKEAYIRSHNVSWETAEEHFYYLDYSYDRRVWFSLNGGNAIRLPQEGFAETPEIRSRSPLGTRIPLELLRKLQNLYGAPEPVLLSSVGVISPGKKELPARIAVAYTNGMTETRPVVWGKTEGRILTPAFASPVISHRADPYIYKHTDGKYYFIASHTDARHNLDGKYQYRYLILRCADTLEDLTDNSGRYAEKTIYKRTPIGNGTKSPHLWAPEIHYIHGSFYIYYTTTISDESSWRIRPHCLACAGEDPMTDNWTEKGPITTTVPGDIAFTDFSLDHTYLRHGGKDYLLWAQKTNNISDIFIAEMSDPWTVCSPSVRLTHPQYNWECHGFPVNEGPAVIRHGGKIFITFSASGTDAMYCMGLLYADEAADLLNASSWHKLPYPVFQSSKETGYFGPGHNSFTKSTDDSEDLIVYHARQEERYLGEGDYQPLYDAGRNAYIAKVFWGEDGMPSFSVPGASIAAREEDLIIPLA